MCSLNLFEQINAADSSHAVLPMRVIRFVSFPTGSEDKFYEKCMILCLNAQ